MTAPAALLRNMHAVQDGELAIVGREGIALPE